MSLQFLIESQKKFQEKMNVNFSLMKEKDVSAYIKEHGYFLIEEVVELMRELPFHKSWKDYSSWNEEDFKEAKQYQKEEAIDALHFIINIFIALGMDEEEVIEMYKTKNQLNYRRQEDPSLGYSVSPNIAITTDPQH